MMRFLGLIWSFIRASSQEELAYRSNFWIHLLNALLKLCVGYLGILVLFSRIRLLHGWDYASALAILGAYLIIDALRDLFIGPSLEKLAGMGQEIWSGDFDFSLLRPLDVQILITFRQWRPLALFDLLLGVGVIIRAIQIGGEINLLHLIGFILALGCGLLLLYALLLAFTTLVFWSPGFFFTWVFDALFQLGRYPVDIYPRWLRILLTWLIPVGLMTTLPARILSGAGSVTMLLGCILAASLALLGASWFFHRGLRRYASASS